MSKLVGLTWWKKPHVHSPVDPVGVALLRANIIARGNGTLRWRCKCGEMVNDNSD